MKHLIATIFTTLVSLVVAVNLAMATMTKELVSADAHTMVALEGHDPVAFFTDGKPVKGDPSIQATHNGSTYFFASKAHQKGPSSRNLENILRSMTAIVPWGLRWGSFCLWISLPGMCTTGRSILTSIRISP